MMDATDLQALSPWIVLAAAAVIVLLQITVRRADAVTATLTSAGLLAALASIPLASKVAPRQVTPLFVVDGFALFFLALIVLAGLVLGLLSTGALDRGHPRRGEHYVLLLLATLGAASLTASTHFASLLLGLETLSVALFVLAAYPVFQQSPVEAGIKYLVLAGISAAILAFGMGLVYAATGQLTLTAPAAPSAVTVAGMVLILAGLGFKLSLVPFHPWTPDVYQGAPPVTGALLATISKGAVFVVLLRYLAAAAETPPTALVVPLTVVAVATMLVGNVLALRQQDLKRLLAYSSIAHMGYLLVPLIGAGSLATETFGYYLAAYFVMSLMAFGVVAVVEAETGEQDHTLSRYQGLAWRRPALTAVLTAAMLALAGMPITAGFIAKFYLFVAGLNAASTALLAGLIAGSAIGLYYYLRVVTELFRPSRGTQPAAGVRAFPLGHAVLWVLLLALVYLGLLPATLQQLIRNTAVTGVF